MAGEWQHLKSWEENRSGPFDVIIGICLKGAEENNVRPRSICLASRPKFEPSTAGIETEALPLLHSA